MTDLFCITTLLMLASGGVTYYAPGVAERVLEYRLVRQQLTGYILPLPECLVALNDCRYLGRYVVLAHDGGAEWCWVIDCAQRAHAVARMAHGNVAEVDYATYQRLRANGGRAWARVLLVPKSLSCWWWYAPPQWGFWGKLLGILVIAK